MIEIEREFLVSPEILVLREDRAGHGFQKKWVFKKKWDFTRNNRRSLVSVIPGD